MNDRTKFPPGAIDIVITDNSDNKIRATYGAMFEFNGCKYVSTHTDEATNLLKVVDEVEGEPELHDILDENEFAAVKEYYINNIYKEPKDQ